MEGRPAAYGNEWLYKVAAVTVIPPQMRFHSDEKIDQLKQEEKPGDNLFDALLTKECGKYANVM